jgi:hypothetical protein
VHRRRAVEAHSAVKRPWLDCAKKAPRLVPVCGALGVCRLREEATWMLMHASSRDGASWRSA